MAEYFCDISAVGNEYQAYADTVASWGVPQDGNGKAGPGHAAAVAIATIDCASASASGAGSLSLLGITVSSTLTGSGATLAANIVTAINGSGTAVSATYSQALLALNRLVWARQNPGLTTQVQVMLRIAGTDWNGDTPVSGGTWTVAPTMGAFAGGANGPFAYLANAGTVFGKTIGNYGLWTLGSIGKTAISQTTDVVHCRSKRSGANLSFQLDWTSSFSGTWKACNYLYDNGTIWSGDNGTLRAILRNTSGSSVSCTYTVPVGTVSHTSRGYRNLDVEMAVTTAASGLVNIGQIVSSNSACSFQRCGCLERSDNLSTNRLSKLAEIQTSIIGSRIDVTGSFLQSRSSALPWIAISASTPTAFVKANGLIHEVVSASGAIGVTINGGGSSGWSGRVEWCGGEVRDSLGVYSCASPISINSANTGIEVLIDNVAGLTDVSMGVAVNAFGRSYLWWNQSEGPNRAFRYESCSHTVDWKGNGTFPHCGVTSLQGDSWSHRISWTSAPSYANPVTVLKASKFFRDTAAVKTLTLQLYTPDATNFYLDEFEVVARYIDSTGVQRTETLGEGGGAVLGTSRNAVPSSAKSWTANGVANYSAEKLAITTAYAIKQNSEIAVTLALKGNRASTVMFYASPEVEIS